MSPTRAPRFQAKMQLNIGRTFWDSKFASAGEPGKAKQTDKAKQTPIKTSFSGEISFSWRRGHGLNSRGRLLSHWTLGRLRLSLQKLSAAHEKHCQKNSEL